MEADGPLIAVRFALYATLSSLFGLAAFGLHALRGAARGRALAWAQWLTGFALVALALSVVAIVLLGMPLAYYESITPCDAPLYQLCFSASTPTYACALDDTGSTCVATPI